MVGKEKIKQLSYYTDGKIFLSQFNYTNVTLDDLFESFRGILVSAGFSQNTIDHYIMELGDRLNEVYGYNTDEDLLN